MNELAAFLDRFGVEASPGRRLDEIAEAAAQVGLDFPDELVAYYSHANGFMDDNAFSHTYLSLEIATQTCKLMRDFGIPEVWGYFPFFESDTGDFMCVCCASPMRGMIVRVRHDDSPAVLFSSLENYFAAAAKVSDEFELRLVDVETEFPVRRSRPRTTSIADELLAMQGLDDLEQEMAQCFAASLYGPEDVEKLSKLLRTAQPDAVGTVLERVRGIGGEGVQPVLGEYRSQLERFCEKLIARGVPARVDDSLNILLYATNARLRGDIVFGMRDSDDFLQSTLQRFSREQSSPGVFQSFLRRFKG